MDIRIRCVFKNAQKEIQHLVITKEDIEELIVQKAKDMGYTGYEGRILTHFDEEIESVQIDT